jgi:electron transfer flavoprotein beta subunit
VNGIKGIEPRGESVSLRRGLSDGYERYELPLPAVVGVKEGINLPRYPSMRGRLKAKKTDVRVINAAPVRGGLRKIRLRHAPQVDSQTVILGDGPAAAPKVVDILEELRVL